MSYNRSTFAAHREALDRCLCVGSSQYLTMACKRLVDLPDELLLLILAALSLPERLSASSVCKKFVAVVSQPSALWKDVALDCKWRDEDASTNGVDFLKFLHTQLDAFEELEIACDPVSRWRPWSRLQIVCTPVRAPH